MVRDAIDTNHFCIVSRESMSVIDKHIHNLKRLGVEVGLKVTLVNGQNSVQAPFIWLQQCFYNIVLQSMMC